MHHWMPKIIKSMQIALVTGTAIVDFFFYLSDANTQYIIRYMYVNCMLSQHP